MLLRTLVTIEDFDPGYQANPDSVLTMDVTLPDSRYPTPDSLRRFYDRVEAEVSALPGVRSVHSSLPEWRILAALLAQTIATFLFGVEPLDPLTFAAVVVVLGVTAAIASAVPANR